MTKVYRIQGVILLGILAFGFLSSSLQAESSESIDARKGVIRLLSADVLEQSEYYFRSSLQYFRDGDLLEDGRDVTGTKANVSFGYAIYPFLLVTGTAGLRISSQDVNNFKQGETVNEFSLTASSAYDVGERMGLDPKRFTLGGSLWVDLTKITRVAKGINIRPTLIASTDWSDNETVPVRAHFNVGFQPKNNGRHFDSDVIPRDFDRFGTHTLNTYAIPAAIGVEFPLGVVTPSLEGHIEYAPNASFSDSPKWVTIALKGKPFPQKNIELFTGVDVGLSSYTNVPDTANPKVYAVPLWNVVLGFGLSQFGKRPNEVGVDRREYDKLKADLDERRDTLKKLKRELSYNTIEGQVVDADSNEALKDVIISFPENPELQAFTTGDSGRFLKYFPGLTGNRIQFSKEGYVPSSKFLSLKPGEGVTVDIALKEGSGILLGDLIVNIADPEGQGVDAAIQLVPESGEENATEARTDSEGRVTLKLPEGSYVMVVSVPGYKPQEVPIEITAGSVVRRSFTIRRRPGSDTPTEPESADETSDEMSPGDEEEAQPETEEPENGL